MTTQVSRAALVTALLALLFAAAACSKKTSPQASNASGKSAATSAAGDSRPARITQASGYAHVTYRPNVHIMEQEEGKKALIGVSSNDASLLFDAANPTTRSLHAGDVLLIKGLLARKVIAAEMTSEGMMVLTQQTALTDVIQDGQIKMAVPVRFGAARASAPRPSQFFSLFAQPAYAQSPDSEMARQAEAKGTMDAYGNLVKGAFKSVVEGWDTNFQATPSEGKTDLNITLTKNVGGFAAIIKGEGYISNFDFDSSIGINQSTLQSMDTAFNNLNGQMNFQWTVSKDSPGIMAEESRIKLPGAIEVPLAELLEGLPLYLEVSGALMIHPGITGGKEFSKGEFRISYDGYQHFSVKPGNINTDGTVNGNVELGDHQDLSPTAPLGMLVAFAAPRVELMLGLNKIYDKSDIKKAADLVDQLADQVAKHLLSPDAYQQYQQNGIRLGKTFENALKTDGAVFFEMVGTSASSFTGTSVLTPCARYDLSLVGMVGASAEAWGQSVGSVSKDIFKKAVTKVDPPGMKLCEDIGKS